MIPNLSVEAIGAALQGSVSAVKSAAASINMTAAAQQALAKGSEIATSNLPAAAEQTKQWAMGHPVAAGCIGASAAIVVAPGLVAAPALGLAGFGAGGVVGGSAAAAAQAGIGNVVAPSLFATLQSAAAGGYGVAAVNGVVQGFGVAGGVGSWLAGKDASKKGDGDGKSLGGQPDKSTDEQGKGKAPKSGL